MSYLLFYKMNFHLLQTDWLIHSLKDKFLGTRAVQNVSSISSTVRWKVWTLQSWFIQLANRTYLVCLSTTWFGAVEDFFSILFAVFGEFKPEIIGDY